VCCWLAIVNVICTREDVMSFIHTNSLVVFILLMIPLIHFLSSFWWYTHYSYSCSLLLLIFFPVLVYICERETPFFVISPYLQGIRTRSMRTNSPFKKKCLLGKSFCSWLVTGSPYTAHEVGSIHTVMKLPSTHLFVYKGELKYRCSPS